MSPIKIPPEKAHDFLRKYADEALLALTEQREKAILSLHQGLRLVGLDAPQHHRMLDALMRTETSQNVAETVDGVPI